MVALRRVVVDDVENDLEPGRVQLADHRLELEERRHRREIGRLGREEADGVVAPVVAEPLVQEMAVLDEGVHGHQLQGRHAELLEVLDHRGRAEGGVGAALPLGDIGAQLCQPLHMGLVDDRALPGDLRRPIIAPGEGGIDHHAFGHARGIVPPVDGQVLAPPADPVAEMGIGPAKRPREVPGIGVDEQLGRIEAVAVRGVVVAVDAIAVEQARKDVRQIAVPDLVGVFGEVDPLDLATAVRIEQTELDPLGIGGEEREIDAAAVPGGPERSGAAGTDAASLSHAAPRGSASPGAATSGRPRTADHGRRLPRPRRRRRCRRRCRHRGPSRC